MGGMCSLGPYFVPNTIGRESASSNYVLLVRCVEVFSVAATLILLAVFIIKPLVKEKRMSWDGLFLLAVVFLFVQEPLLNYQQHSWRG